MNSGMRLMAFPIVASACHPIRENTKGRHLKIRKTRLKREYPSRLSSTKKTDWLVSRLASDDRGIEGQFDFLQFGLTPSQRSARACISDGRWHVHQNSPQFLVDASLFQPVLERMAERIDFVFGSRKQRVLVRVLSEPTTKSIAVESPVCGRGGISPQVSGKCLHRQSGLRASPLTPKNSTIKNRGQLLSFLFAVAPNRTMSL
jgi:hypothetical protein